MDSLLPPFQEIAPYLTHPLVLIGFVLLLVVFAIHCTLLKTGVIRPHTPRTGGGVVQTLVRAGFVIALVALVLGFALQFYKTHWERQPPVAVEAIIERLESRHQVELADWDKQATEAVAAMADLRGQPDAPLGIDQALTLLEQGRTETAEAIFQTIAERKEEDIQEAAADYRHLGALALLGNTQTALAAYRRATELDPDNAEGWKQLGHLLLHVENLDEAEVAYRKVKALGEDKNDQTLLAAASGNLGIVYRIRGDLDQAEAMYRQALEIHEALGARDGMARDYGNLGNIHQTRGDLGQAEALYRQALKLDEALGAKEGMAANYGNLGIVYRIRGDRHQAEAMLRKALALFQEIGARPQIEQVQGLLRGLR